MMLRIGGIFAALIALGLLLYVAMYFHAQHEDSVKFVVEAVKQSKAVQEYVGRIQDVRLSPGGPYGEEQQGNSKAARVTVDVQGNIRAATVVADASFHKEAWKLDGLTIDGRRVPVN